MSERDSAAAAVLEEVDGLTLEKENRELASKQVRRINDALRKVRSISRQSQQMLRPVLEPPVALELEPVLDEEDSFVSPLSDARPTDPAPASTAAVEEVVVPRRVDTRRERDDSTEKLLIPEPALASPVSDVFRKAFEMFESECAQFHFTRTKNSPVIRSWKLA